MARGAARTNHLVEWALCPPEQGDQRPVFWRYNLSAHHDSAHSLHAKPQEALVGALERDLVKTVGGDRKAPRSERSGSLPFSSCRLWLLRLQLRLRLRLRLQP